MSATFLSAVIDRYIDAGANPIRDTYTPPKPLSPAAPARPLRSIHTFKVAEFSPAKAEELKQALEPLPILIEELGDFHFGPDMGLREPGYNADYAITADFNDQASYIAFCRHPAYQRVVNDVIKPMLAPGEHVGRIQFAIQHATRARQSLMQADPPLFNLRYGKSQREGLIPNSPSSVVDQA